MKSVSATPVTVKIRVGDGEDNAHFAVAQAVAQAGADGLIVHGRHWREDYGSPCRYNIIREIAAAASIPVIGNGDVRDIPQPARHAGNRVRGSDDRQSRFRETLDFSAIIAGVFWKKLYSTSAY